MNLLRMTPAMTCPKCFGQKRIAVRTAVVGKGWQTSGRTCPMCRGKGKLPRR